MEYSIFHIASHRKVFFADLQNTKKKKWFFLQNKTFIREWKMKFVKKKQKVPYLKMGRADRTISLLYRYGDGTAFEREANIPYHDL